VTPVIFLIAFSGILPGVTGIVPVVIDETGQLKDLGLLYPGFIKKMSKHEAQTLP